jgi:PPOX class probable F420-dependent enzyme
MLHELNPAARAFLEEPRFAVLATIGLSGLPQQSVIWYYVDGEELVFNSRRGRVKDRNIVRDSRVSVCVAEGDYYITIDGPVQIIEDQATAQADIKYMAIRYNGPETGVRQAETEFSKQERISYRLALDHVLVYGFDE